MAFLQQCDEMIYYCPMVLTGNCLQLQTTSNFFFAVNLFQFTHTFFIKTKKKMKSFLKKKRWSTQKITQNCFNELTRFCSNKNSFLWLDVSHKLFHKANKNPKTEKLQKWVWLWNSNLNFCTYNYNKMVNAAMQRWFWKQTLLTNNESKQHNESWRESIIWWFLMRIFVCVVLMMRSIFFMHMK